MKKKIGEIYNKPIVIGNPNEFNKNEIALSELGGDSFDDGMEYYLVLDKSMYFNPSYIGNADNSYFAIFNTSIIEYRDNKKIIINGNQTGFDMGEYIAFSITDKYIVDARDGHSIKQYIIDMLNENNTSLNDTSKFKQITKEEYYSLLD